MDITSILYPWLYLENEELEKEKKYDRNNQCNTDRKNLKR